MKTLTTETNRLKKTIESLQSEISQNKADILFLFSTMGTLQKVTEDK